MGSSISSSVFPGSYLEPTYNHNLEGLVIYEQVPILYLEYDKNRTTILISHGNYCDLNQIDALSSSHSWKANIIAYDYSGYGLHENKSPSEDSVRDDIKKVFNYATEQLKIDPKMIFLYGESLGSGPTCYLANYLSRFGFEIGGVILVAPFESCVKVVSRSASYLFDMFENYKLVPEINYKVLLIHGLKDEVINHDHSMRLYERIKSEKKLILMKHGSHNNLHSLKDFDEHIRNWIK